MIGEPDVPLSAAVAPLTSLGLYRRRAIGAVVGRPRELTAITRGFASARSGMSCIVLEGEPGIGKTRLLLAAEEIARGEGFVPVAVTADEEIRGPFLLARSIFASLPLLEAVEGTAAEQPVQRVADALAHRDDPSLEHLSLDRKLVRVFDLAALAFRAVAALRPLALLIDDLQWADEDSLRMLRYLVRTDGSSPILLMLATRPDEAAFVTEAVTLLADMDRLGILQRLRLSRLTQLETTELLQQVLGGQMNLATAAVMHAQAEGVPFILAEQAQAYREAGLIQQIDGMWTLARNAQRLLPSAVRTLIQRRATRLPEETRTLLAETAVLGRSFSLRDLAEVKRQIDGTAPVADALAETLTPAVGLGLLVQQPPNTPADYSFAHEGVREYAASTLPAPRRRAIHGALVSLLSGAAETPECHALLAQHALAAGQSDLAARAAIAAAQGALRANAPEEVLRLVEMAQSVAANPQDRVALLCLRDDALGMLRRPAQRLEGLPEVAALAEALGDTQLEFDVMLRRAAALRLSEDYDAAASLARRVREEAVERGEAEAELAACVELGQDLLHTELGEGSVLPSSEADLDGAWEAFERAAALAEQVGDERRLAAATRELGVISASRLRAGFVDMVDRLPEFMARLLGGESIEEMLPTLPVAPFAFDAMERFQRALAIYERLGDRQGTMATIIALAGLSWAPEIHMLGSVHHMEEIRRLWTRMKSLTRESERALAEAQMLYGSHVYACTRGFLDVAIAKGAEAHAAARALGQHGLEFAAAGGVALVQAELEAIEEANRWLERAAAVASAAPTPFRARQLELWRGMVHAAAGDASGMRAHLERAGTLATEQGQPAAHCEALAQLALRSAWLGTDQKDEGLFALAVQSAGAVESLKAALPGRPPWGAQADAALALVALQRGDLAGAAGHGRAALAWIQEVVREELLLDTVLPAAAAVLAEGEEEERTAVRMHLRLLLALIAHRIADEEVRGRWFRSRLGRELTRLAGPLEAAQLRPSRQRPPVELDGDETTLLRLVAEGHTNEEIAEQLDLSPDSVAPRLAMLFGKLGASTRTDATVAALMGRLV